MSPKARLCPAVNQQSSSPPAICRFTQQAVRQQCRRRLCRCQQSLTVRFISSPSGLIDITPTGLAYSTGAYPATNRSVAHPLTARNTAVILAVTPTGIANDTAINIASLFIYNLLDHHTGHSYAENLNPDSLFCILVLQININTS